MKDRILFLRAGQFSGQISGKTSQKIAKNCQKFKNSVSFHISKVRQIRIRRHILENRRFRAILGRFRKKKTRPIFRFFAKIARNRPKSHKIAYFFLTDSKRRDFEDSKTPGLFEK